MLARHSRSLAFRLAFFTVLAAVLVWPILPDAARLNEFRDVHHLFFYERAATDTVRRFGELPLWNPYYCGGFDAMGAPQTRFLSPSFGLSLLFGAERAEILTVFFFAIVGMEGMYRWLRLRVRNPFGAMFVAPIFALSGQFTVAYFRGWIQFSGFELVPWVLFGIALAARRRPIGMAIASIAFATMLGLAGFFAAPMLAIAALCEGIVGIFEQPRDARLKAFGMLAATASFMLTVACLRLWPVAETLMSAPRIMAGTPGHSARSLLAALVGDLTVDDENTKFAGGFYVGATFLGVAFLGAHNRRGLVGLFFALIMGWLAFGYGRTPSLFGTLREVPMFSALRYPERFLWLGTIFASLPAALAIERLPLAFGRSAVRRVVTLSLAGCLAWSMFQELRAFHRVAKARPLGTVLSADAESGTRAPEFRQSRGNRWLTVHVHGAGLGSLSCYETHRLAMSPLLRADLPAEEYLAPGSEDAGTVTRTSWSPNKVGMHVVAARPARVLVNKNWAPGWHASVGKVVSHEGLLAVEVPQGTHDVVLSFWPWSTIGGASVTLTALLCVAFLAWQGHRHGDVLSRKLRRSSVVAVVLPWLVFVTAYAASPDDKWPPPPLFNPNGSPAVLADDAPHEATPIGATFRLPIRVEGGHLIGPDERHTLTIEVYLRRLGRIARTTTMFVHVERRKDGAPSEKERDTMYNLDHQVIGGSFYLSDAPKDRLVRDAFGVHLPKAQSGTWDVWVSFGHVSGRKGHSKLASPGQAIVDNDRVRIGSFTVP